jgi:polyhydroxybutyrate depolymerase
MGKLVTHRPRGARALSTLVLFLSLLAGWPGQAAAEDRRGTLEFQGVERHYILHRGGHSTAPLPLVVALHGLGQSVDQLRRSWTLDAVADREGFAVVYPEALVDRWAYADSRPVALPEGHGKVDDTGFILALVDRLIADNVANPDRIYVAGASNGGLMAWTLACRAADRFAGVAALITGMIERQMETCRPERLVPLVVVAGTDDWVQAYDGSVGPDLRLLSVPETLAFWRGLRGCRSSMVEELPSHVWADRTLAVKVDWTDCRDPAPLRFYRIQGGGHFLPTLAPFSYHQRRSHGGRSQTIETAEEIWDFFKPLRR